jgi:hypothetical protein
MRPDHVLNREAKIEEISARADVDGLEVVKEGRPVVPGRLLALGDDVVARQGADRDEGQVRYLELLGEPGVILDDRKILFQLQTIVTTLVYPSISEIIFMLTFCAGYCVFYRTFYKKTILAHVTFQAASQLHADHQHECGIFWYPIQLWLAAECRQSYLRFFRSKTR